MMFHLNSSLSGKKKKNHSVKDVNGEGYLYVRKDYIREISLPPSQFFCKCKITLKKNTPKCKKKKELYNGEIWKMSIKPCLTASEMELVDIMYHSNALEGNSIILVLC